MHRQVVESSDTVDVTDVVRTLRRQWRGVLAFLALGVVGAIAVILFAPRRFDGKVTVLARPSNAAGGSISGRVTGLGELLGGMGGLGIPGSLETELQMLRSRTLAGEVVDSLQLQFLVSEPKGISATSLIASSTLAGTFAPRDYVFEAQQGGTYRVTGDGATFDLTPGVAGELDIGRVTLQPTGLPPRFELEVLDREDAITRLGRKLTTTKAGGDVARIVYRGDDSVSAAAAPNALVKFYLDRRKTSDRGVNQRRVEYVTAQLDSVSAQLTRTERELRGQQEATGVFDAEIFGQVELEAAAQMRQSLTELQVEEGAIGQLLNQADAGGVTSRELAAYPAFLRGSSVSPLAQQLSDLEGQRIRMLERRTERDPEIVALDSTMQLLRANILAMARSYASSISRQRAQLQTRVDSVQRTLLALPAAAERGGRLQRDVLRLTQIHTALSAQLVEARLAAIGEGGEIRQIDEAVPPRKPSFPRPMLTLGIGTAGGLLTGLVAALFLGWFGRWLRDPLEIERAVGISAQRYEPNVPLLVSAMPAARSVLVIPLEITADTTIVAERLASTARQRALDAVVVDFRATDHAGNGKSVPGSSHVGRMLDEMESQNSMSIVQLPDLRSDATIAALRESRPVVLVAPPGPVDRARLAHAVDTLRRLQAPCAGVVISDAPNARLRSLF